MSKRFYLCILKEGRNLALNLQVETEVSETSRDATDSYVHLPSDVFVTNSVINAS
jgi:hypothetical protein